MSIRGDCRSIISIYRIGRAEEIAALNLREYLYSDGVSFIEWIERLPPDEIDEYLEVSLAHDNWSKRQMTFTAHGKQYEEMVKQLRSKHKK